MGAQTSRVSLGSPIGLWHDSTPLYNKDLAQISTGINSGKYFKYATSQVVGNTISL